MSAARSEQFSWMDATWLRRFRGQLRRWYQKTGRPLPWRQTQDAYRIWISEIMLQQTTVAAVIPYFHRFLERFPTVHALATAPEDDVLQLWEGLGYYSRARNLHRCAQQLIEKHDGVFPRDVAQLQALPGIGRYTAGAIASFAFDRRAPIVEANTLRLYSRLMNLALDPRSRAGQDQLWAFAETILPRSKVGEFNQALMELGSTVCRPSQPVCRECPVRAGCRACAAGTQQTVPVKAARPQITELTEATVAIFDGDAVFVRRRQSEERWGGMWDFPRYPCSGNGQCESALIADLDRDIGLQVDALEHVTTFRHSITRYRIELRCFRSRYAAGTIDRRHESRWVSLAQLGELALPRPARRFATTLQLPQRAERL